MQSYGLSQLGRRVFRDVKRTLKFEVPQRARYLYDAAQSGTAIRLLLVSDLEAYCSEQQFAPFHQHRAVLRERFNVVLHHALLKRVMANPQRMLADAQLIGLKLSFRTRPQEADLIVRTLQVHKPAGAKIIYFDGDDDSAVQWPNLLPSVDLYVKKHLFRDRAMYQQRFHGKNNLTTYVSQKHGISFAENLIPAAGPVPANDVDRIFLGYNLALDEKIVRLHGRTKQAWKNRARPNDIVCRASLDDWLFHLRKDVAPILGTLGARHRVIAPTHKVSQDDYDRELASSKICVSPFGFGEICWRDFEAVLWGCLMIKPDMSHIETHPDIFIPYETYVPVKWDFSDLESQCVRFLEDAPARQRIVDRAYAVLADFYEREGFFDQFATMMGRVGLQPRTLGVRDHQRQLPARPLASGI